MAGRVQDDHEEQEIMGNLGNAIESLIWAIIVLMLTAVPLAIWKLADIAVWLFNHISVTWK